MDEARPTTTKRRLVVTAIKIGIAAVLVVLLLRSMEWQDFREAFEGIRWGWFVLAVVLHFPGYLISAWRWRILLRAQEQDIPFWKLVESYLVATFFNYTLLGTLGGDIVRMTDTGLGKKRGAQAASAVFVERLTGFAAMVFVAGLGLALMALSAQATSSMSLVAVGAFVLFAVFGVALYVLAHPLVLEWIAGLLDRPWPLFATARRVLLKLKDALAVFRNNKRPVYVNLAWALLLQLNVAAHYLCLGLAMGLPAGRYAFGYLALVPLITLILTIPVTPGGVGVREWTLRELRSGLGFSATVAGGAQVVLMGWLQVGSALLYGAVGLVFFVARTFRTKRGG